MKVSRREALLISKPGRVASVRFWTAPAERSGDGALVRERHGLIPTRLVRAQAVSRFAGHRRPGCSRANERQSRRQVIHRQAIFLRRFI